MAARAGCKAISILANCLPGSHTTCRHLRKISVHGPPSKPGTFLLWQCRHVTIALQLFFVRIFGAVPSYKRPKLALLQPLPESVALIQRTPAPFDPPVR